MSTVATVLTLLPVVSLANNMWATTGCPIRSTTGNTSGRFIGLGLNAFILSWLMNVAGVLPCVSAVTHFTWFTVAQFHLNVYGFFALAMFGAIYYIVPRVTGLEWPCPKWIRIHLWVAAAGILLFALPLAIGGVLQGIKLNDPTAPFPALSQGTLMWLRVSSTGELLILLGNLLLLGNITVLSGAIHFARTFVRSCKWRRRK